MMNLLNSFYDFNSTKQGIITIFILGFVCIAIGIVFIIKFIEQKQILSILLSLFSPFGVGLIGIVVGIKRAKKLKKKNSINSLN